MNARTSPSDSAPENSEALLPSELLSIIGNFADAKTLSNFSLSSPQYYMLFKPIVSAKRLLEAVFNGDLDNQATTLIESISDESSDCILKKVYGIEPCGRTWQAVSSLQFTTWIGDSALIIKLLAKVPANKKDIALSQLIEVRDQGLEHGKHMAPFRALIAGYQQMSRKEPLFIDNQTRYNTWRNTITPLQFQLSIFGLQWLCDPVRYFSEERKFEPKRSLQLTTGEILHGGEIKLKDSFLGKGIDYISKADNLSRLGKNHSSFSRGREKDILLNICGEAMEVLENQIATLTEAKPSLSSPS